MRRIPSGITERTRPYQGGFSKTCEEVEDGGSAGFFEGAERASVIGVEDAPAFQVGDAAFDGGADAVDLLVEGFLPIEEPTSSRFLDRGDQIAAYVALVAKTLAVQQEQEIGFLVGVDVMPRARHRVGDMLDLAVQIRDHPQVVACRLVLAGVRLPDDRTTTSRARACRRPAVSRS